MSKNLGKVKLAILKENDNENLLMKVKASVRADPGKGDKIVRRKGRLYVINKRDPNRKQRQKGPARKK